MRTTRHLPSLEALVDDDDTRMTAELDLLEASKQVTYARRALDRVEALVSRGELRAQEAGDVIASAEELARLGYRLVAAASELRRRAPLPAARAAVQGAARRRAQRGAST
jgi:hypothetical protein